MGSLGNINDVLLVQIKVLQVPFPLPGLYARVPEIPQTFIQLCQKGPERGKQWWIVFHLAKKLSFHKREHSANPWLLLDLNDFEGRLVEERLYGRHFRTPCFSQLAKGIVLGIDGVKKVLRQGVGFEDKLVLPGSYAVVLVVVTRQRLDLVDRDTEFFLNKRLHKATVFRSILHLKA